MEVYVKVTVFTIWGFTVNFWTKHDRDKIRTASCSYRQDASKDIHDDLERSQSKFDLGSRSQRGPSCISVKAYWWDKHIETSAMSLALLNLKLSAKTVGDLGWPQTTLAGSLINTWPWVIMNGLRAHDPERIARYWSVGKDFNIFPHWLIMESLT